MTIIRLMNGPSGHRRGFSLIELMTVVALIAIMAALAFAALGNGVRRTRVGTSALELSSLVQEARQRAALKGREVLLVVAQASGVAGADADGCSGSVLDAKCARWWIVEDVVAVGASARFDLTAFDPAHPTATGDVVAASGTLPQSVRFGVGPGAVLMSPPAPFATLPNPTTTYTNAIVGCSFCDATLTPARGAIRFTPTGEVSFNQTPTSTTGAVLFVTSGHPGETSGFGLTAPGGVATSRYQVNR